MYINIAGIVEDSVVDGYGLRYSIFTQGCPHNCFNCHNPETHDYLGGKHVDCDSLIKSFKKNPLLSGITITGGEPFIQPKPCTYLARKATKSNLNVWVYTGYTFETLVKVPNPEIKEFLGSIDVLVDGKYCDELKTLDKPFVGSSNQRIIDVKRSLLESQVVLVDLSRFRG